MENEFKHLQGKGNEAFTGIPENYFRDLPDKILLRSKKEEISKSVFYLRPLLIAVAASLLVLIGLAAVLIFNHHTPVPAYTDGIRFNDSVREMIVTGDLAVKSSAQDTVEMVAGHNVSAGNHTDDANSQNDDIFDTLQDIPVEILIEYLLTSQEYIF